METDQNDLVISLERPQPRRSFMDTLLSLSPFERAFVGLLVLIVLVSGTYLLYQLNDTTLEEVPRQGGRLVEGIVGTPRFINPLLAISNADKDLAALVYAGLLTRNADGELVPELAESYTISEDGTIYTFTLRENLTFHNGESLTSEDVSFTIERASTGAVRSPVFANWEGVTVETPDARTVVFTLPEPYAPFIENARLGILPKHIWDGLSSEEFPHSQFNVTPVGSGPYKVTTVTRDGSGIPSRYELVAFEEYSLGKPHIDALQFRLYGSDEEAIAAYLSGEVDSIGGIAPTYVEEILNTLEKPDTAIHRAPLMRTFGIFFNHNRQPIFLRDEVREALDEATPKKAVVGEILRGYGTELSAPLPSHVVTRIIEQHEATTSTEVAEEEVVEEEDDGGERQPANHMERARLILEDAGWERNESGIYVRETDDETITLSVTLSTVNTPELVQAAERIAESWREVGVQVELKVFEPTDLTQSVIRPRRFDALLFGMVVGHELDLYAFWHSSQRNDPGLNIAQFADIETDSLLENMRTQHNEEERAALYYEFLDRIGSLQAAIFLYSPDFIYVVNDRIHNVSLHPIAEPCERFDTVHEWYIQTDRVWPFVKDVID